MTNTHGGDPMDPLFRRAAADRADAPRGACLDADVLAAWADGSLSREDTAALQAHAADCARCRAMLAAMVRTEPAMPAPAPAWWRGPLRWAAPLAAAAAALAIWVVVERPAPPVEPALTVSRRTAEPQAPAPGAAAPSVPLAAPTAKSGTEERTFASKEIDRTERPKTAPPAAVREPANRPRETQTVESGRASAPAAPERQVMADTARRNEYAAMAAPPPEVISPDGSSRWRITPTPGLVERSTDGGRTWVSQETGAPVRLSAGSSPAPGICWLVGPGGLVVRTIDGRTWQRITVPDAGDLIAVAAVDADTATVTAADGRRLRTADGGVSWVR